MIIFYLILVFFLGMSLGSFLNAWIWRARENISIYHGRSMCPKCRQKIAWYDNIPLFGFISLRGKCRMCKVHISWQYPIVEIVMGILFLFVAYFGHGTVHFITPEVLRDWAIIFVLSFIFIYDFKYKEILDQSTLPISVVLYLFSVALGWHEWWSMILGAAIGGGFFLLQYLMSSGRWVGGGDIRLGILMGVILGWPGIVLGLMSAYIIGAVISLIMIAFKKLSLKSETPFGTYLAVGTFITMFWGQRIIEWYLSLLN